MKKLFVLLAFAISGGIASASDMKKEDIQRTLSLGEMQEKVQEHRNNMTWKSLGQGLDIAFLCVEARDLLKAASGQRMYPAVGCAFWSLFFVYETYQYFEEKKQLNAVEKDMWKRVEQLEVSSR